MRKIGIVCVWGSVCLKKHSYISLSIVNKPAPKPPLKYLVWGKKCTLLSTMFTYISFHLVTGTEMFCFLSTEDILINSYKKVRKMWNSRVNTIND